MITVGFLSCQKDSIPGFLHKPPPGLAIEPIRETAVAGQAPDALRVLLIPADIDQRLFAANQPWLRAFFMAGGALVFNGLLAYPFLDELRPFVPLPKRGREDLRVRKVADHPVFVGVTDDDLSLRRGVAGFYGRGANPPPAGARVLAVVGDAPADRVPLDWEWTPPEGGRLLMHAGNNLWMHQDDPTSAARIAPQLLDWCLSLDREETR